MEPFDGKDAVAALFTPRCLGLTSNKTFVGLTSEMGPVLFFCYYPVELTSCGEYRSEKGGQT
jgi:hypothetical protein